MIHVGPDLKGIIIIYFFLSLSFERGINHTILTTRCLDVWYNVSSFEINLYSCSLNLFFSFLKANDCAYPVWLFQLVLHVYFKFVMIGDTRPKTCNCYL